MEQHARDDAAAEKKLDRENAKEMLELKLQQSLVEKSADHEPTAKLEKLKLEQAVQQTEEREVRERTIEAAKLEASIVLALDSMILGNTSIYDDHCVPELAQLISEAKLQLRDYRMANSNLSILLREKYSEDRKVNVQNVSTEAHNNILYLKDLVTKKQRGQDDFERQSKMTLGEQTICVSVTHISQKRLEGF